MNDQITTPLRLDELEQLLIAADPGIVLAPGRILRRVIKKQCQLSGLGLQVPHRKTFVLRREELFAIASRQELGLDPQRTLPDLVMLLPQPVAAKLASVPRDHLLRKYWRLLFHAQIHVVLQQRRRDGTLNDAAVRERMQRLGFTEFEEVKAVLQQEHFLLPPGDDATIYEELAALYLELHYFHPDKLNRYFPSLDRLTTERVLAEDVDADVLYNATRLAGAAEPDEQETASFIWSRKSAAREPSSVLTPAPKLLLAAEREEQRGNFVRAAMRRTQAGAPAAARATIERFVEHLQKALQFSAKDAAVWQRDLTALLQPASAGIWPSEARLLFDLQKICIDHERTIYAADLVEWFVSWGKRPVKRVLPYQGDVLAVKHLRVALGRLGRARVDDLTRHELSHQLHQALHHAEAHLRERLRPVLVKTLDKVELRPANAAEMVARDKLVEELLDLVVARGFLNLGDLRDAIARNRLKMPDLAGVIEFFRGDRLIRANRRFAESLDGVYHRGEIYLRWLQRFSSAAFGTATGRFLTRYFALPFGMAFVLLEGVQHLLLIALNVTGLIRFNHLTGVAGAVGLGAVAAHGPRPHLANWWSVLSLGGFILGVLYLPWFRRGVLGVLHLLYRAGLLLFHLPWLFFHIPIVEAFFQSRLYLLFYQFVAKPLAYSLPAGLALYYLEGQVAVALFGGAVLFVAMTLLFNSQFGQWLEEVASDALVRGWHLLSVDWLPGLIRWILYLFRRFLETVERLIYTVDEWLRFRQGDHPASFYVKAVLGLFWFGITYVVRFAVNLLIEPQINPIKHFPVVTVSHKLVLTMLVPPLSQALAVAFKMDHALAWTTATAIGFCIPGIFGFLVWELKENWKIYTANQAPTLDAEMVCSHGETMLRLLRPGFHSGTLPKLYAKLRRAKGRGLRKQKEALHHVVDGIRHFVERTLLATLAGSRSWGLNTAAQVAAIHCGCNRIRIELSCPPLSGEALLLDLEEHAGWLIGGLGRRGWLASLNAEQTQAMSAALAGFYKRAGVDMVREQIAALLPPAALFTITKAGLVVWLGDAAAVYDLSGSETLEPTPLHGPLPPELPTLRRSDVLFREMELRWSDWVETWELPAHQGSTLQFGAALLGRGCSEKVHASS